LQFSYDVVYNFPAFYICLPDGSMTVNDDSRENEKNLVSNESQPE